jgi:spore photoproduct lyase
MHQAGYPLGFIVAPLFIYPGYQHRYAELFQKLALTIDSDAALSFEFITHRFTARAKKVILERFPNTKLDLDETKRRPKYGRYGLIKYIYPELEYQALKDSVLGSLYQSFPKAQVEYFT